MLKIPMICLVYAVVMSAGFFLKTDVGNAANAKCAKRTNVVTMLKQQYKEAPVGLGISQKSTEAFEVFVSEKGSWTVTMTMSNGMTCIMATGHSWQSLAKQEAGSMT